MGKILDVDAYPLAWPDGWRRTDPVVRLRSKYQVTFARARDDVLHELELLGAREVVVSTNVPLRRDGVPYASRHEPDDTGVAVYWVTPEGPRVIACDAWRMVRENLRAVGLSVAALRQIERAGATQILERAYQGFAALPAATSARTPWREVLGFSETEPVTPEEVRRRYLERTKACHPDRPGGSHEAMSRLNEAFSAALRGVES